MVNENQTEGQTADSQGLDLFSPFSNQFHTHIRGKVRNYHISKIHGTSFSSYAVRSYYEICMPDGIQKIKRGKAALKVGTYRTILHEYPAHLIQPINFRKSPKKRNASWLV